MQSEIYVTPAWLQLDAVNPHDPRLHKLLLMGGLAQRAEEVQQWLNTALYDLQQKCTELTTGDDVYDAVYDGTSVEARELSLEDNHSIATADVPLEVWKLYAEMKGKKYFHSIVLQKMQRDGNAEYLLIGRFRDPDKAYHTFLLARWGERLPSLATLLAKRAEAEAEAETLRQAAEALEKQAEAERKARAEQRAKRNRKLAKAGKIAAWIIVPSTIVAGLVWLIGWISAIDRSPRRNSILDKLPGESLVASCAPLVAGGLVVLAIWLICYWAAGLNYRR